MGEDPGDEKHDVDVKNDEEHGRDIEFDRISGFAFGVGGQTAFVRRILDLAGGRFLTEEVTRGQNTHAHADSQYDLDENR